MEALANEKALVHASTCVCLYIHTSRAISGPPLRFNFAAIHATLYTCVTRRDYSGKGARGCVYIRRNEKGSSAAGKIFEKGERDGRLTWPAAEVFGNFRKLCEAAWDLW